MNKSVNIAFWLFTTSVFSALVLPTMFQDGIFMDGLIYASIANNLSVGNGSYWYPEFTKTIAPIFNEHPPFGFILQSWFIDAFGSAFYIEKIYSGLTALFTAICIVLLWLQSSWNSNVRKLAWLPVLLWIIIPKGFWSYQNNMLENTMGLFSILAFLTLLVSVHSSKTKRLMSIIISSLLLLCSFLTKGFPGLYPLAFFGLYYIVFKKQYHFLHATINSIAFIVLTVGAFVALFVFIPDALENLTAYFNSQVMGSLSGKRIPGSRWFIVGVMFQEIIAPALLALVVSAIAYKKKLILVFRNARAKQNALFFLLVALSASVPIMVSPKQLSFYIVPSLPYFALSIAFLVAPAVVKLLERLNPNTIMFNIFKYHAFVTIPAIAVYCFLTFGNFSRNAEMIRDVDILGKHLGASSTITIGRVNVQNWGLMGYLQRRYLINLDRSGKMLELVLLEQSEKTPEGYEFIDLSLNRFKLVQRKKGNQS